MADLSHLSDQDVLRLAQSGPETTGLDQEQAVRDERMKGYEQNQNKFGTLPQQALAGVEGIGEGVAGPLFTAAERASGLTTPENMLARREANPMTHAAGQAAGLVGGSLADFGESAALNAAGKGATELAGLAAPATALGHIGAGAIRASTEMALLQAGDETSKMIMNDPNTSFQSAVANVGLAAAMGAGGGAALGAMNPLWKAVGGRFQKFAEDFRGRALEKLGAPEAAEALEPAATAGKTFDPFQKKWIEGAEPTALSENSPAANGIRIDPFTKKWSEAVPSVEPAAPIAAAGPIIPEKLTPGQKAFDFLAKKGLAKLSGESLGAAAGAALGAPLGHAWLGALVGKQALGPILNSILPSIVKPIIESPASGAALKSVFDYGMAVVRGDKIMSDAAKAVFKPGAQVLSSNLIPTERDRNKLTDHMEEMEQNPDKYVQSADPYSQYLPNHAGAKGQTMGAAYEYLKAVQPKPKKVTFLDKEQEPSAHEVAEYKKTLDLAEQPALVFSKIKDGTLTTRDLALIKTVYPSFYQSAVSKLHDELINHVSKEKTIPYQTRIGLAKFFGEPLDSTMLPNSLMSIQQSLATAPMKPPMQVPKSGGKKDGALAKQANLLQTPQQASQERHTAQF